ncbi:hypothetical protein [Candidatus Francisella endociliophora]|uniref:hypothetical protein n=1 Tax=Candidatus Francisella endociliophora TaxID=653937 RepID=UPI0006948786|nr:hypothetical protein [Francisella sp. FSC1006]
MRFSNGLQNVRKRLGLTLVELLIASTISIIAIGVSITIYASAKENYSVAANKNVSNITQLNIKKIILKAIRTAGLSCGHGFTITNYIDRTGDIISSNSFLLDGSSVRIGNVSFLGALSGQSENYQANTDYIMVKTQTYESLLSQDIANTTIYADSIDGVTGGDYIAVCNDSGVNLVKAKTINIDSNQIEIEQTPSNYFGAGDYIGKFQVHTYYIGSTDNIEGGDPIYALYLNVNDGVVSESYKLFDRVSDLEVYYATVNEQEVNWTHIDSDIDIEQLGSPAIQVRFKVDMKEYKKTILL